MSTPSRPRSSKPLTAKQKAELAALANLPEHKIDTNDIPEVRDWSGARRGVFYRPSGDIPTRPSRPGR